MKLRNKILLFTAIVALVGFNGCKSKKDIASTNNALEAKAHAKVLSDAIDAEISYQTISTNGSIEVQGKRLSTSFKLVKDSMIQASVHPLFGVEVMRCTFTPDSVIIIDRLKKRYIAENFSTLAKSYDIQFNFYNLQALLTNQLFLSGKKEVTPKDYKSFKIHQLPEIYLAKSTDRNKITYDFSIDASNRILSTFIHNADNSISLQWVYSNFAEDGNYFYPKKMQAEVLAKNHKIQVGINYSKLNIDKKFNIDNSIPKTYKKVGIKELLSTYIK